MLKSEIPIIGIERYKFTKHLDDADEKVPYFPVVSMTTVSKMALSCKRLLLPPCLVKVGLMHFYFLRNSAQAGREKTYGSIAAT